MLLYNTPQQLPRYWEKNGFSIDIPLWWFNSHWPGLKLVSLLFWVLFLIPSLFTSLFSLYLSIPLLVYTLHFLSCSPWAILFEYVPDMMCVRCLIQRYIYGSFCGSQSIIWYSIFKVLWHFPFIRQCVEVDIPGIVSREWHQLNTTFFVHPAVTTCIVSAVQHIKSRHYLCSYGMISQFIFWMGVGRALWRREYGMIPWLFFLEGPIRYNYSIVHVGGLIQKLFGIHLI